MPNLEQQRGFTLIELLMAMAVFGFMLSIIVVGFINVVNIHNEALAGNQAQDSARSAMDTLVQAVRDSSGKYQILTGAPGIVSADYNVLCLETPTGWQDFYAHGSPVQLWRGDVTDCTDTVPSNVVPITSNSQKVSQFLATPETSVPPAVVKPEIEMSITLGSSNGTTTGTGAALQCNSNNADRTFCATVTLTSGAEPR